MIGGKLIPKVIPFMVSIQRFGTQICGGTLINSNTVLTAAHCALNPLLDTVLVNSVNAVSKSSDSVIVGIEEFIPHHEYSANALVNDIAILKLSRDLDLAGQKVELGFHNHTSEYEMLGYGQTKENRPLSGELYSISTNELTPCGDDRNDTLCTSRNAKKGICHGDSGGPLFTRTKDRINLIGVISFSFGCKGPVNVTPIHIISNLFVGF